MYYRVICYGLLAVIIVTVPVLADNSLWTDEAAGLYEDREQYEVGDIINVVIEEDASALQSATTNTSQDSEVNAEAGTGWMSFLNAFGFGYSDSGEADGSTERSGTLTADITTRIDEILPGGNFRIVGTKNIKINGEKQVIKLAGVIRPEDIALDNSISSQKVAEAEIEYEGDGDVAAKQRPGLLERLLNWLF